jgi:beta-lactamase class A
MNRIIRFRISYVVALMVAAVPLSAEPGGGYAEHLARLRARIEAVLQSAQGVMGVSIKHFESGTALAVNGDEPFPMASTFKLPLLVELHAQATAGRLKWDDRVEITPRDQHLGSGDITPLYDPPGVALSWRNLANLMMMISDNSATDLCLAKAGAAAVTSRMRSLGINGIRVDRPCQELILDYGNRDTAKLKDLARDDLREAMRRDPRPSGVEARFAADDRFASDPRDTATPNAMVALLERIWKGEAVDRKASDAMLELLKRCRTGENRLRGLLPEETVLAHKTGTIGGVVNDVGIMYLPDGTGHVAIAVMSKRTRAATEAVERTIAHVARYAYDYFLFADGAAGKARPAQTTADWDFDGNGSWTTRDGVLVLEKAGVPSGPIRRPAALAIRQGRTYEDVEFEVDIRSTAPADLAVRDVLLIVGYQTPTRFYYVHLSAKTDNVHNGIFLVNDADRRRIDDGKARARLTDQHWQRVRLVRRNATGRIEVFFGDETEAALAATDRTLTSGRVGVGSFDETAEFRNFKVVMGQPKS